MRSRRTLLPHVTLGIVAMAILSGGIRAAEPGPARGFLGVSLQPVSDAVRAALALEPGAGVMIQGIVESTSAEEAGLETGDVILELNDRPIRGPRDLMHGIGESAPGDTLDLEVWRRGMLVRIGVVLGERPGETTSKPQSQGREESPDPLGIRVAPLTDQLAAYFVAPGGVLVTRVDAGSPAEVAGVLAGDVIVAAGEHEIGTPQQLAQVLSTRSESTILLALVRNGADIYIRAALPGPG